MKVPLGSSPAGLPPLPGKKWNGNQTRWFFTSFRFSGSSVRCAELMRVYNALLSKEIEPLLVASSTY